MTTQAKRYFVGGLFHGITTCDLEERFSKFGQVSDVNVKTKLDSEGQPFKTFAHLNIQGSEKELNKFKETYNKTKWKGHTLTIEEAKESFVDKLKKEQEVQASPKAPVIKNESTTLTHESVKNMKVTSALPGSEVEGMQNWVVGKYGRVLPVIKLRTKDKKKVVRYDPSKYCHTVKQIEGKGKDATVDPDVPVSDLTWNIDETDAKNTQRPGLLISTPNGGKRQRPVRKIKPIIPTRANTSSSSSDESDSDGCATDDTDELINKKKHETELQMESDQTVRPVSGWLESDSSEEEEPPVKKAAIVRHDKRKQSDKDNSVKVLPIKNQVAGKRETPKNKQLKESSVKEKMQLKDSLSADKCIKDCKGNTPKDIVKSTDNLLAMSELDDKVLSSSKTKSILSNKTAKPSNSKVSQHNVSSPSKTKQTLKMEKETSIKTPTKKASKEVDLEDDCNDSAGSADTDELINMSKGKLSIKSPGPLNSSSHLVVDEYSSFLANKGTSEGGSHKDNDDGEDIFDLLESGREAEIIKMAAKEVKSTGSVKIPNVKGAALSKLSLNSSLHVEADATRDKQIAELLYPEAEKRTIREYRSDDDEYIFDLLESGREAQKLAVKKGGSKGTDKPTTKTPESKGTSMMTKIAQELPKPMVDISDSLTDEALTKTKLSAKKPKDKKHRNDKVDSTTVQSQEPTSNTAQKPDLSPKKVKSPHSAVLNQTESKKSQNISIPAHTSKDKHEQSNQQRLASIKQRELEAKAQKSAVQQALKGLDSKPSKKIVFDSDSEEEKAVSQLSSPAIAKLDSGKHSGSSAANAAVREKIVADKSGGLGLFDSSSGEDEESDVEMDDEDRFRIRPEYEGKSGAKLMRLQSRYGTDERFKLGAHFAESDSEESDTDDKPQDPVTEDDTALERAKALDILKEVVGSKAMASRKAKPKGATFRDMASLHYDPSKEEHRQFEVQTSPKQSKKTKKSKKSAGDPSSDAPDPMEQDLAVTETLPQVSKERFFEVDAPLKEVFEHKEKAFSLLSMFGQAEDGQEGQESAETSPDKVPGKATTFPWQQQDFLDDSSEDEDMHMRGKMADKQGKSTTDETSKKDDIWNQNKECFFFTEDDSRLKEGIRFSYRDEPADVIKAEWLRKRPDLVEAWKNRRKRVMRRLKSGPQTGNSSKGQKPFMKKGGPKSRNFNRFRRK